MQRIRILNEWYEVEYKSNVCTLVSISGVKKNTSHTFSLDHQTFYHPSNYNDGFQLKVGRLLRLVDVEDLNAS